MILAANSALQVQGDTAWYGVENRRAPHQLEAGLAAAALNHRFDEGKPQPRHGVALEHWGRPGTGDDLVGGGTFDPWEASGYSYLGIGGLVIGQRYLYERGDAYLLTTSGETVNGFWTPAGDTIAPGVFTATTTDVWLWAYQPYSTSRSQAATFIRPVGGGNTCGYGRFNDPNGSDNGVLLTDEWRSDGGRGKAWRIYPGNTPQEIPLNGHDLWGTARLVQCDAQLVLLRHGAERHYFAYDAVDGTADTVTLNCIPAWNDGDEVVVMAATADASWSAGPNLGGTYYVRNAGTDEMSLYDTAAHAIAGGATGLLDIDDAEAGKFYVERQALKPGFYGNFPPPLRMVSSPTETAFEVGFEAVPTTVLITDTDNSTGEITAANHGLQGGQAINIFDVTGYTGGGSPVTYYAAPINDHAFRVYDDQDDALADDGSTGIVKPTNNDDPGYLKPVGAAGGAMPGGTEGVYVKGRLVVINGKNLLISDPLDILHFTPYTGTLPSNQSRAGAPVALIVGGNEDLLVVSETGVEEFQSLETPASWKLVDVTREFGAIAPLAAVRVGANAWLLNRRGVSVIGVTQFGIHQADPVPVSLPIQRRFESVDWLNARLACATSWNNRIFFALPFKGQDTTEEIVNNGVLVFNQVNNAWEDLWQGDYLTPYSWSRLNIAGEERLTFATPDGLVCWLTDGFEDFHGAIATELTTRAYFGGQRVLACKLDVNWDTWNPSLTVAVQSGGQGEDVTLDPNPITYDKTKYVLHDADDYDPDTSTTATFDAPHREDYSPAAGELLVARLDAHQNLTEHFRLRLRDRAPQVVISNTQGSVRINAVELAAAGIGSAATKET